MSSNKKMTVKSLLKLVAIILASVYLTFIVDVYALNTDLKRVFIFGYFITISFLAIYLKKRFEKKTDSRVAWVLSAIIAGLFLVTFQDTFLPTVRSNTVTLQAGETGEVWLTDVEIDGELVPVSQVQISDNYGWEYNAEYDDYVFYPKEDTTDNHLSFSYIAKETKLVFAVNTWSGTVNVFDGEGEQTVVNLYGENPEQNRDSFSIYAPRVYNLVERVVLNSGIFVISIFFLSILLQVTWPFRYKKQDIKALSKKTAPYALAGIHWLISFYTDDLIFVLDGSSARFVVLKAVYLLVLVLIWRLLFRIVGGIHAREQRVIKSFLFFLIFFSLFTAVMICIWPGNWVWDDIWVFKKAVVLEFEPWQHILTSCVYIISLMLLPFPAGIVIVQYTFIAGVIGFILGGCYVGLHKKGYIALLCIPFVLFPVLAMVFYPIRLIPYAFLELLFFFIMMYNKGRRIGALIFLNAILAVWRTEGIIFLVLGPILFSIRQKDKQLRMKYFVAVIAMFLAGALLQNHFIGNSKEYYEVTAYTEPMDNLVKYEYQIDSESPIIRELRETIDVDMLLYTETGENAFWNGAYARLLETQQYDVVKMNFVKLVLKHPLIFIKERIHTFLKTSALTPNSAPFIGYQPQITIPEFITDYPFTSSINDNLRVNTLSLLTGRQFDLTGVRMDFRIWYNLLPPLALLLILLAIEIRERRIPNAICLLSMCMQGAVIFVAAPATYFMYYFPIYLSGYFWGVHKLVERQNAKLG